MTQFSVQKISLTRMRTLALVVIGCLVVAACAETQFLIHSAKRVGGGTGEHGAYKVGKPYQIAGTWYYPAVDYSYDETGIASWYGPNFHGKKTANGGIFDQEAITAAHRTLPIPSVVRVTNLENGRSLVVTVNDRGPFAKGRIIDMSRRSAELLGFINQGTAKVRVQIMERESRSVAAEAQPRGDSISANESPIKVAAPAKQEVATLSLEPLAGSQDAGQTLSPALKASRPPYQQPTAGPVAQEEPMVRQDAISPSSIFVQAGAFGLYDNANRVMARLSGLGTANISQILVNGRDLYRVRLGPLASVDQADELLAKVIGSGYPDAQVIVD